MTDLLKQVEDDFNAIQQIFKDENYLLKLHDYRNGNVSERDFIKFLKSKVNAAQRSMYHLEQKLK